MTADQAHGLRLLARQARDNVDAVSAVVAQRRPRASTVAVVAPKPAMALDAAYALALGLHRAGRRALVLNAVAASGVVGPAAAHCLDPDRLSALPDRRAFLQRRLDDGPIVLSPALGLLLGGDGARSLLADLDETASVAFVAVSNGASASVLVAAADQVLDVVGKQLSSSAAYPGGVAAATVTTPEHRHLGGEGLDGYLARIRSAAPDIAVTAVKSFVRNP